jgi:hypothetical protein
MNDERFTSKQNLYKRFESSKPIVSSTGERESPIPDPVQSPIKSLQIFPNAIPSKSFEPYPNPLTSSSELKNTWKSFKPITKLCQMLEYHEEKPFNTLKNLDKSYSISSSFIENFQSVNQSFSYFPSNPSSIFSSKVLKKDISRDFSSNKGSSKQSSLLELREKAKQKELFMLKRKKSAVMIQAWFRGLLQRKRFKPLWQKHLKKVKFQTLREISKRIKILFAPYIVLNALKKWVRIRRREKAKVMQMFRRYSATFIQKCWKGFKTRQKFSGFLKTRKNAREKIKSLITGWKTRKVLQSSKILHLKKGIQDLEALILELESTSSESLYNQMTLQIPIMKQKLLNEFKALYNSNKYLKPPKLEKPSNFSFVQATQSLSPSKDPSPGKIRFCRDEEPVKTCKFDLNEDDMPLEVKKPEKVFKNFLRRGQNAKYNPKTQQNSSKSPSKAIRSEKVPQICIPPRPESIPSVPTIPYEFEDDDLYNPEDLEIPKNTQSLQKDLKNNEKTDKNHENPEKNNENRPGSKNFLKRKSKTYEPKKIEWKKESRVKCWTAADDEPKVKKISRSGKKGFEKVNELEFVFQELCKKHVDAEEFFRKRLWEKTKVPQVLPCSRFIEDFSDDGYEEYFELLQNHYLLLCNEEI